MNTNYGSPAFLQKDATEKSDFVFIETALLGRELKALAQVVKLVFIVLVGGLKLFDISRPSFSERSLSLSVTLFPLF